MSSLIYGRKYYIQNGYGNWNGGFLDTCGGAVACKGDNLYDVSTSKSPDRVGEGTGIWKIRSAMGKADDAPVMANDFIYLQNQYKGDGGFLDTCGYAVACKSDNLYDVSTSKSPDRAKQGTGTWRIIPDSSCGKVEEYEIVHLLNGYNDWAGGFLDTCGYAVACKGDNLYDVSTHCGWNRKEGTTLWRFCPVIKVD